MATLFTTIVPVLGQMTAALSGLLSLALMPPVHGNIVLVSITQRPIADIANAALASGALIARHGPGGHSLIVVGDRDRLIGLIRQGLIPLAAPAALCAA